MPPRAERNPSSEGNPLMRVRPELQREIQAARARGEADEEIAVRVRGE